MTETNVTRLFTENWEKSFSTLSGFFPSLPALFDIQINNFKAVSDAQRRMFEGLQAIAEKQAEVFAETSRSFAAAAQESLNGCAMCGLSGWQKDFMKNGYQKASSQFHDMIEIMDKSGKEAAEIINKRISASAEELQAASPKTEKKTVQKKAA